MIGLSGDGSIKDNISSWCDTMSERDCKTDGWTLDGQTDRRRSR